MRTVIIVVLHAHTRVNASWMSVYCMCWHVCCVFTVQWATEGALHPADREDGGAEKEPASNRWNSIPGLGAAPSDCSHYGLHTNHTSLKILIADRLYMQAAADSWKAGNFTVVGFFFLFHQGFIAVDVSSSSDSVLLFFLHYCSDIQYFHVYLGCVCLWSVSVVQEPCK